jgi:hypothetical protein
VDPATATPIDSAASRGFRRWRRDAGDGGKQGTPRIMPRAAHRHRVLRSRGTLPTVLITRSTSPFSMRSTTWGEPSATLATTSASTPIAVSDAAVPSVASTRKPARARSRTQWPIAPRSSARTETSTVPDVGIGLPASICAFA